MGGGSILGQFGNLWMGRVTGPDASEWLARFFGKYEHSMPKWGWSWDGKRRTDNYSEETREYFHIDPDEFKVFPMASLDGGYTAVARNPHVRGWQIHVPGDFIKLNLGPRPESEDLPPLRTLDHSDIGYTWGPNDLQRLGLRPLPPKRNSPQASSQNTAGPGFRLPE